MRSHSAARISSLVVSFLLLITPAVAFAGSQTFSTPGAYTFTVLPYTGTLSVTVNGAGGGGTQQTYDALLRGGTGGQSSFNGNVVARGGSGGTNEDNVCGPRTEGSPGAASGGNISNVAGGGASGGANVLDSRPCRTGGGSGGRASARYDSGALPATVTVIVGQGGAGTTWGGGYPSGQSGQNGSVTITWTDAPAPPPPSLPACNATTTPTTKATGTSGSQTFTTPGDHSFAVPQYDGQLTVEVWGGGGGGAAPAYTAYPMLGWPGGTSSFDGTIIARGGGGMSQMLWQQMGGGSSGAEGGTASGGTTNITGGYGDLILPWTGTCTESLHGGASPHGGVGGASSGASGEAPGGGGASVGCTWGGGGAGGYASRTYATGQLSGSVTVTVGAGGLGANKTTGTWVPPLGNQLGGDGAPGRVKITWTSSGQTTSICAAGYVLKDGKCVSTAVCNVCPAGQTLNENNECVPDTICPAGFHWDEITQQCTLDEPATCPGGTTLVNNVCTCPAGTHWDTAQNMCVPDDQCPDGQRWDGTQCVTDTAENCPAGQHWDATADACVPDTACPPGQHWDTVTRQCVAGCPAGTVLYEGRCQIGLCIPGLECGTDGNVYRRDLQCNRSLFEECEWGCTNALCNPPPQPRIITWKVAPTLVRTNATTGVFWNVINVLGCTVSGTNGDLWSVIKGSEVSSPIVARTTYTLHCTPYKGATWTDRTAIVNIIPVFKEQ